MKFAVSVTNRKMLLTEGASVNKKLLTEGALVNKELLTEGASVNKELLTEGILMILRNLRIFMVLRILYISRI